MKDNARYVIFHCADFMGSIPYYESVDLIDALHPQTIMGFALNDKTLDVGHGAPLRLRVERQLGYKHSKLGLSIEALNEMTSTGLGRGGNWDDQGGNYWVYGNRTEERHV